MNRTDLNTARGIVWGLLLSLTVWAALGVLIAVVFK